MKTTFVVLAMTAIPCLNPFATKSHATVGCQFLCYNSRFQDFVLVYADGIVVCVNGRNIPPANP